MQSPRLRTIWQEGGCALNCWLTSPSSVQEELLASLGFDSLTLDLQHGDIDYRDAIGILTALTTSGATALARVPMTERGTSAGEGSGPKTRYHLLTTDGGIVADQPGKMAGEAAIGVVLKAPLGEDLGGNASIPLC